MVKKIILLVFVVFVSFLIISCTKYNRNAEDNMEDKFLGIKTEYNVNFNDKTGDITEQFVLDEQTALEIANSVLKNIKGKEFIDNTDFFVYELADKDVIVVSRMPVMKEGYIVLGGDVSVAINKKDGRILKIWTGE